MTRFLWRLFKTLLLVIFLTVTVVILGVTYYIKFQLPDTAALNTIQLQVPLQIFTSDGKLMAEYGEQRRIPIPFDQIPQQLINAVLATEDQRYYQHPGIDIPGLIRATIQLAITGRKEQGGSTITMQVARSFYLNRNKTFGRKLREILLALKIDHTLSKQKILELYLNKIFLGNRAYGVEAAAKIYYGKSLRELTIDQLAMLAGLPKAPSALNPLANAPAARKRRDHVLSRMLELNYIDQATYQAAIKTPLHASFHEMQTQVKASYAAELVRQQLEQMYGEAIYTDGFDVYTTIDSRLQEDANRSVQDGLLAYDQRHGYRGPEANLGKPGLTHLMAWEKKLRNIPAIGSLEPAAVMEMTEQTITALRSNGSIITIPWSGLVWARKQINADYLGRIPRSPADIVKPGDVIRIIPAANHGWQLTQVPKAEGAMVALNPQDGKILAMTGGFDFQLSKFNRITNALRQPGSTFKPFIYSAALNKGFTLATVVNDSPVVVENISDHSLWRPQNDTHKFYGPTRLRDAIIYSRNTVSVKLLMMTGVPYTIKYLKNFSFTPAQLPPTFSLALGTATLTPLNMITGYAVFANGGFKVEPYIIDVIRNPNQKLIYQAKPLTVCASCVPIEPVAAAEDDADDTDDDTKKEKKPIDTGHAPRTISVQNAYLITSALHDVIESGTAVEARNLHRGDLAGKTGTTQNQVDAWFVGYNSDLVALSWVGFDQPQSLHEYGNKAALPIWMQFMSLALKGKPEHRLEQPPGVVSIRIDPFTGARASMGDPAGMFEYFMKPYLPNDDKPEEKAETESNEQTTEGGGLY
jgi:penicillin-binding protein 1A